MESRDPRERDLSAFLRAGAGATFVWGEIDCSLFMADWCRKTRGVDPAAITAQACLDWAGVAALARATAQLMET